MRRTTLVAAFAIAMVCSAASSAASMLGYDPEADAFEQYHEAVARAQTENKLVLVIAGGDWCGWCHRLNKFMKSTEVSKSMEDTFVVVKVYVGDENFNEFFFSQLPEARGAPHFWVISPDKHVLISQSTAAFERGKKGYDKTEFLGFVDHWKKHSADHVQRHAAVSASQK
jgi:hypothetical protein